MLTRRSIEIGLIRVAERYPDRVGVSGHFFLDGEVGCILGAIAAGVGIDSNWDAREYFYGHEDYELRALASSAANLNNSGIPWGEIPRLLGLVPGEKPAEVESEEPVSEPVQVTVASAEANVTVLCGAKSNNPAPKGAQGGYPLEVEVS